MTKIITFKKFGQKKKSPSKTDPLRKFYSSLLKQNPKSEMATKWLMHHGLLPKKKLDAIQIIMEFDKLSISKDKYKDKMEIDTL
jgi:hypothetical protein